MALSATNPYTGYPYDTGISNAGFGAKTGWKSFEGPGEIKSFMTTLEVSPQVESSMNSIEAIKEKLCTDLVKEIYRNDCVQIEKQHNINNYNYTYKAKITVASAGTTGCIIEQQKYQVLGLDFTDDQIQEAIKNTFPEYFL